MSKKKAIKKNAVVLETTASVHINQDHVVSIGVARRERALKAELVKANKTLKDLETEKCELNKACEAELDVCAKTALKKFDGIVTAYKKAGFEAGAEVSGRNWNEEEDKLFVNVILTVNLDDKQRRSHYYRPDVQFPCEVSPSAALKRAAKAADDADGAVSKMLEHICEIRKSLSELPSHERVLRALVAENALQQSLEGQELLDVLAQQPDLPEHILALPAPKKTR